MRHAAVFIILVMLGLSPALGAVPVSSGANDSIKAGVSHEPLPAEFQLTAPVVSNSGREFLAQPPMGGRPGPSRPPGMRPHRAPSPPMTRIAPPPVSPPPRPLPPPPPRPLPPPRPPRPPLVTGVVTVVETVPVEAPPPPPTPTVKHVTYPLVEPVLINPPAEPATVPEPALPPLTETPVTVTPPRDAPPPEGSGRYETRIMTTPSGERYEERVLVTDP